jgi:beta-N-acetylhexosaminidase
MRLWGKTFGVAVGVPLLLLTGSGGVSQASAPAGAAAVPGAALAVVTPAAVTAQATATSVYDRMTQAQRIGQLFMVGGNVRGPGSATTTAISRYHVGNVILTGRTTAGANSVRAITSRLDAVTTTSATAGVPLFVATDQEGGYVQVLQGPGFSRMPTALTQGTYSDSTLTADAKTWGLQVRRSGVDVNLAPVMDTVSSAMASSNPPIGQFAREYGHTSSVVADKGSAFLRGMKSAGLAMTAKHFPGLGRVTANTDTTAGVKDTVTTRTSAYLNPFRAAITAGSRTVMISSAIYTKIDASHPAVFSSAVVTGLLRGSLGYKGVVISDDLGNAKQVQAWAPGTRAVDFLAAGGDIVLTVNSALIPSMVATVTARANANATFRSQVAAAVMRVLTAKAAEGLLGSRLAADGALGSATVSALQRWLGVSATGHLDTATVRALQARLGTPADGAWGPASMAALQTYLGAARDGARTWNSRTIALLQQYLVTQM